MENKYKTKKHQFISTYSMKKCHVRKLWSQHISFVLQKLSEKLYFSRKVGDKLSMIERYPTSTKLLI